MVLKSIKHKDGGPFGNVLRCPSGPGSFSRSSGKRLSLFARGRGADGKGRVDKVARSFSIKFYNSKTWEKCREAFKRSRYGICERCGMPGEEVHHKIYLSPDNINDPYITLSWDNLELLCMSCHTKEHMSKHSALRDGLMFDDDGQLIEG